MSELPPEYHVTPAGAPGHDAPADEPASETYLPQNLPPEHDPLHVYFMQRRDALIAELRALDRYLGRPQTIPVRRR